LENPAYLRCFSVVQALLFSCSVQLRSDWVAARLLHTEGAWQDSNLQPAD
jgi:hypothetical protein